MSVQNLLRQKSEWISRYSDYAEKILANTETIKEKKEHFNQWDPLYLYMNITAAKKDTLFSLRYLGQDVAKLNISNGEVVIFTNDDLPKNNRRDFGCTIELGKDCKWKSKDAQAFRKHFKNNPKRLENSKKGNEEHRVESLLLSEFTKKGSKKLLKIQPVRIAGICRFQMKTPLKCSTGNISYSGGRGGGIDILARYGTGMATKLCIMEVKDENKPDEKPKEVIRQALTYATFIRELLRSESGEKWWKIFGFKRSIPTKLELLVVSAMPSNKNNDTSFANETINIDNDVFRMHYLYFEEKDNHITKIETSLI